MIELAPRADATSPRAIRGVREQHELDTKIDDMRMHAKPYGAPPAPRRIVMHAVYGTSHR